MSKLLDVVCHTTGLGFAAIARVTEDRWITCSVKDSLDFGLAPGDELPIKTTICDEVRAANLPVYIDHVEKDDKYCNHPVPVLYKFQSYVSVPIYRKDKSFFGTLCALDPKPASVSTKEVKDMFSLFADLISFHLDAIDEKAKVTEELKEELENTQLREQFIAILGHDLKNPIATTRMSADIMLKFSKEEMVKRNAAMIKSTSFRMEALIDNILDFARGKLGEGIILQKKEDNALLEKSLKQVVNEVKAVSPEREIQVEYKLEKSVNCDHNRISQLFSNLLSNADLHGDEKTPVTVNVESLNGEFKLEVRNNGSQIPTEAIEDLFKPFYRDVAKTGKKGLGLGLYISLEIAHAHKGNIEVHSAEDETIFTFAMPLV
ncbi:GAF domain-containing sensor histidine kinase [Antarcticibacterium sp. W02-3]|uniref:sensor histidine kinase n=1 Tax=Antarcticibacterium sp. W02-3 TaxID=2183747 RepID=UPI003341F04B